MMPALRARSLKLTGYLQSKLVESKYYIPVDQIASRYPEGGSNKSPAFTIITPLDPNSRGTQLSLAFLPLGQGVMLKAFDGLKTHGVIGDERKPDVIRLAPTALYNTAEDCDKAAKYLEEVFQSLST